MVNNINQEEYEELVLEIAILAILDVKLNLGLSEQKIRIRYIIKHAAHQMARLPANHPKHVN